MIGFIFPGQGAQRVGMGQELYRRWGIARETFDAASDALGYDMARLCFEGPADLLKQTEYTQPALLTVAVATCRVLAQQGVEPDMAAGLSLGEYSALVAGRALEFSRAVTLVQRRGRYMQSAVPLGVGGMAAIVGLDSEEVERLCLQLKEVGLVQAANYNCPGQVVISGELAAVQACAQAARMRGAKRAVVLEVSAPFHCDLMKPAAHRLYEDLVGVEFASPVFDVFSNVEGRLLDRPDIIRQALYEQVYSPVQWQTCVERMHLSGCRYFVEVGVGRVLSGFVKRIANDVEIMQVEDAITLENLLDMWEEVC